MEKKVFVNTLSTNNGFCLGEVYDTEDSIVNIDQQIIYNCSDLSDNYITVDKILCILFNTYETFDNDLYIRFIAGEDL